MENVKIIKSNFVYSLSEKELIQRNNAYVVIKDGIVSFSQAFFMATKQGGSLFGKTGSLEAGYYFDALVISDTSDKFNKLSPIESVERFCA